MPAARALLDVRGRGETDRGHVGRDDAGRGAADSTRNLRTSLRDSAEGMRRI